MGIINHHVIIATTYDLNIYNNVCNEFIVNLDSFESSLFHAQFYSLVNGFRTIILCPDGSKDGWEESEAGDNLRERFIAHLKTYEFEDGSSPWSWVEVEYGDYGQKITRGNNVNKYENELGTH